jgi:hypothetical protein
VRPLLKPALRRLWRAERTLQLGVDPELAVVLDGVGPAEARFLLGLDGTRTRAEVLGDAVDGDPGPVAARRLLDLLGHGGALDDAATDLTGLAGMSGEERARLAPDLASWSLARADAGASGRTLARRRAAAVAVHGAGRVGATLAGLLAAAGVGHLSVVDPQIVGPADLAPGGLRASHVGSERAAGALDVVRELAPSTSDRLPRARRRPDVAVLCLDADEVPQRAARLLAEGVGHLLAVVRETVGLVGPLVLPGRTGCLRCLDLHRSDRDPAWPLLAAQLEHPGRAVERSTSACDVALATAVAAHAALAVLAHVDDPAASPPLADAVLELRLPDALPRRRSWGAHPACGCTWPGAAAG